MAVVRAFIVDDNPTLRANLAGTLRDVARVELVGEADSEAGGSLGLREHAGQWDLAIVDLFIGDGSGLRVPAARANPASVVVLSNHTTHQVRALPPAGRRRGVRQGDRAGRPDRLLPAQPRGACRLTEIVRRGLLHGRQPSPGSNSPDPLRQR